jgi:hypothetical protein
VKLTSWYATKPMGMAAAGASARVRVTGCAAIGVDHTLGGTSFKQHNGTPRVVRPMGRGGTSG